MRTINATKDMTLTAKFEKNLLPEFISLVFFTNTGLPNLAIFRISTLLYIVKKDNYTNLFRAISTFAFTITIC